MAADCLCLLHDPCDTLSKSHKWGSIQEEVLSPLSFIHFGDAQIWLCEGPLVSGDSIKGKVQTYSAQTSLTVWPEIDEADGDCRLFIFLFIFV